MPTKNVWLSSTLRELLDQPSMTEAERDTITGLLIDSIDDLTQLATSMVPADLAKDIHSGVDQLVSMRQRNPVSEADKITCRKGCAHCCSQIVASSEIEAALLVQTARKHGIVLDRAKLERQRGRNDSTWLEQSPEDRVCVFLKDNLCQVYDDRPASCRKYFSISDPSACDLIANPGGQTQVWFAAHAEILTSAMFTVSQTGFLPDLLLIELGRKP